MRKLFFLAFVAIIGLSSCDTPVKETKKDLKEVKVANLYTISVPDFMKEMKNLNKDASLQYGNTDTDVFTIVVDEKQQEFVTAFKEHGTYDDAKSLLENYSNSQIESFKETIKSLKVTPTDVKEINGSKAEQYVLRGVTDDLEAGYLVSFIKGKENIFMVMSWTTGDGIKKYDEAFRLMHSTFKLL
ncbi:hypothetical protein [Tenacibaculum amylolyticum]|uniref:hypothetical protein n=1 Tax=Tenacibaculum amylolyticum TaxID=104269 RepID=UPI003892D595